MDSISVLSLGNSDLSSMGKEDVSKNLFGQIHWEDVLRSGVFLQHRDHQLLEKAQANLAIILDNQQDAKDLATILIKIAENCTSNLTVQRYAFTRIEEILGLGTDASDTDGEVFGLKNAKLFTDANGRLLDAPFIRALNSNDHYLLRSASLGFSSLVSVNDNANVQALVNWVVSKITASGDGVWEIALPALTTLVRNSTARSLFIQANGVVHVVNLLNRIGVNGNTQKIYDLSFILWTLSLSSGEPNTNFFVTGGVVATLVSFLSAASSRKVARVTLGALNNLGSLNNADILTEMLSSNIERVLENLTQSALGKNSNDPEFESDIKALQDIVYKNYRELTTFDKWASEVHSGALRWGVVHSEKFWRDNARHVEVQDFSYLKQVIALLKNSNDPTVISVALYDIGEFTRFYPNGRVIVSRLGGKDLAMEKIADSDAEIQRYALQCVSKVMVNNWEFMK